MRVKKSLVHLSIVITATALLIAACSSSGGASGAPSAAGSGAGGDPNDLLAKIKTAGVIKVGTDPAYPPQSELKPDGSFEGFDIDVANEIGKRLGVTVKFDTPDFTVVEAGKWAGRFDISVGSVTITEARLAVLNFTEPYYFTPAQTTATKVSGITTLDGLAGKTICVGAGTTYFQWMEGTLKLGDGSATAPVPTGAKVTTVKTDKDCALSAQSGRKDFEGWLSSSTTVADAIKDGAPFVNVGDPVFYEPLAVATDKSGPVATELQAALDKIITDMHADGTLSTLSKKWFEGQDLTKKQ